MLYVSNFLWLLLIIATSTSMIRIISGNGKNHDVLSFSFHLVAWVMLGFGVRWMFAPNNFFALDVMRVFGSMLAIFLLIISRFYKKWG